MEVSSEFKTCEAFKVTGHAEGSGCPDLPELTHRQSHIFMTTLTLQAKPTPKYSSNRTQTPSSGQAFHHVATGNFYAGGTQCLFRTLLGVQQGSKASKVL